MYNRSESPCSLETTSSRHIISSYLIFFLYSLVLYVSIDFLLWFTPLAFNQVQIQRIKWLLQNINFVLLYFDLEVCFAHLFESSSLWSRLNLLAKATRHRHRIFKKHEVHFGTPEVIRKCPSLTKLVTFTEKCLCRLNSSIDTTGSQMDLNLETEMFSTKTLTRCLCLHMIMAMSLNLLAETTRY